MRKVIKIAAFLGLWLAFAGGAMAADDIPPAFRSTGYPIPRFVSLNEDEAFVRAGPASHYPVKWTYRKAGLPVEIILEFENWRKIRDIEGQEGWVFYSLLSGKRTGIIQNAAIVPMLKKPRPDGALVAQLQKGVIVRLKACGPLWCEAEAGALEGWIDRKFIWGIYETENFD